MADTVTPNKVELARPVDADALQAWNDKHGITPRADGTFDTLPYGESPVGDETILDQVRVNAVRHDIPNLRGAALQDATMVYVGGGATLHQFLDDIRAKCADPAYHVWTSNMTARFLVSKGDAVSRIDAYLATVNTLSADFSQVVRNRDGQIVDRASGMLSLSRPDRFRWDYQKPYLQTIVADGKQLWLYDSDLEQVTVRALEQGLGSTPAMLLSGSGKVGDAFASSAVQRHGDWTWYRLAPKQQGSDFEQVSLAFDRKGELAAMELRDKLGQLTVIEFGALRRNVALDPQLFRFEPPPGADVIGRAGP